MKTIETIQTGIIGTLFALLSLYGLNAVSAVQTITDSSWLAGLTGGIIFGFLYFVILLLGYFLGQSWYLKLMSGFLYGVFGAILGQIIASLSIIGGSELSKQIVAAPLCGLLITLLFFHTNRHVGLATLIVVIALVFFVLGIETDFSTIIMVVLISAGVWFISPLASKMLVGLPNQSIHGNKRL